MRRLALVASLGACSRAEPLRVEVVSEVHHEQEFSTLHVRFRDRALTQRLGGLVVKVHARCVAGQQVYEDEVAPLVPMIQDDADPRLVYTTDELEDTLFRYDTHPLFGVPERCDLAVTRQRGDAKPTALAEVCLHADGEVSAGRCAP